MKKLTFSRKSWHYQFADAGNYFPRLDSDGNEVGDICEYTKAVMKFFVAFGVAAIAFYFVAFIVVQMIFGIAFSLWFGVFLMSEYGIIASLFCGVGIISFLLYTVIEKLIEWRINRRWEKETEPDGFVKHAYKSWKEKYCARITFTD